MSAALVCRDVMVAPSGAPVLRGVDLHVPAGRRAVLVGPSGAGKTTLLRAITGLEPLSAGTIELGGRRLDAGVPAHRRRVSVVFQEPRLLAHLRVDDNVALPLRAGGVGRQERRARATALLDEVGLAGIADRGVRGLSGGEQQRVALARALCAEPDLLLLDEPLAAVDPNRREGLRRLIVRIQSERALTTLVITHDRAEAAELAESLALMLEGRIVQQDDPRELFERPRSAAVARFFGAANLLRGTVRDGRLQLADGAALPVDGPDGPATYVIRPEALRVAPGGPIRAQVIEAVYAGTFVRVALRRGAQRLEVHVPPGTPLSPGEDVELDALRERLWRFPDEGRSHPTAVSTPAEVSPLPSEVRAEGAGSKS
jgi:putative spermidine/putrescine transport system ATP-binding protein